MTVKSVADLNLIFLVVTARPEFEPAWVHAAARDTPGARPAIARRGEREADRLDRARQPRCRVVVIDEIVARTDGVPLFLEEVTQAIVESGGMSQKRFAEPQRACQHDPPALQASLVARLDRLGAGREIAEVAAVIGRDFTQ